MIYTGFTYRGNTTDNADDLSDIGVYRINQLEGYDSLNYPLNNGYIVNFRNYRGFQLFYAGDYPTSIYYRHLWNSWTEWKQIPLT